MYKYKIPSGSTTTNKTIRYPDNLIDEVEKAISGKNCSFSAFVIVSVRMMLDGINQQENQED